MPAKKKKIVRRSWTASDVREFKSLAKKRIGVAKISKGSGAPVDNLWKSATFQAHFMPNMFSN
jgi:hypothetical protein